MYKIVFGVIYSFIFLFFFEQPVILEDVGDAEYPELLHFVLLPDIETNQKITRACTGVMISVSHFLTSSKCVDQVRREGPHAMILYNKIGIDNKSTRIFGFHWKFHKYYDGKNVDRDIAVVHIQDTLGLNSLRAVVSVYCKSCYDYCYLPGWGTFSQNYDNVNVLRDNILRKTRISVLREELADGTSTDIFVQKLNSSDGTPLDFGSPLVCHKMIGNQMHTGVVGIFTDSFYTENEEFRFRSFRGLLTWISNWAMGTEICPSGNLKNSFVCSHTDCDNPDVGRYGYRKLAEKACAPYFRSNFVTVLNIILLSQWL
ncbi:hypothetical protein HHI36_006937 [Cryptolaemus montrouzieri]|uniref:Peptidase S1 domain-containing protein n=1 Tax=Cryptolaemus montrouzieri TaxID=559131 RepID=A0ABD2MN40_9CUCU